MATKILVTDKNLFQEVTTLVEQSRQKVAATVNSAIPNLYWQIGKRINEEVLENERAEYGKQIVVTLSRQLIDQYGRSFEYKNLRRMMQFAQTFDDHKIVVTLSRQLSWNHFTRP